MIYISIVLEMNCDLSFILIDTCEIPDPPIMLQVEDTRDTRIGFFPHVVINVTWDTPKGG